MILRNKKTPSQRDREIGGTTLIPITSTLKLVIDTQIRNVYLRLVLLMFKQAAPVRIS